MMSGKWITFEGPDGSGKSTVLRWVSGELTRRNIAHTVLREPGGTVIGEKIREILLNPEHEAMSPRTEALLYAASRAQLVNECIKPLLERGETILCDRYVLSSFAYQGFGRKLGINDIRTINEFGTDSLVPDRTLFFKVDPEVTLQRKRENFISDRLELEEISFHQSVFEGYLSILESERDRFHITEVDANRTLEEVRESALHAVLECIGGER